VARAPLSPETALAASAFYARHRFGVHWTEGNLGDDAKAARSSWNKEARAVTNVEYFAGLLANRITKRNPIIVANPVGDPNAIAYILVDVDSKDGGDDDLRHFLSFFDGPEPDTLYATSSGPNSRHYYFKPPEGASYFRIRFEGGLINIDSNGYLVASPAQRADGRGTYQFRNKEVEIAELPLDVYERWTEKQRTQHREAETQLESGEKIAAGLRHQQLRKISFYLCKNGATEEATRALLRDFNTNRCDPPKAEHLVDALVRSTFSRHTMDTIDEFTEFHEPIQGDPVKQMPELGEPGMTDLFVRMYGRFFRYLAAEKTWIAITPAGHFTRDEGKHSAQHAVVDMTRNVFDSYAAHLPEDNDYRKAAEKFHKERKRSMRSFRDNVLSLAEAPLRVSESEIDRDDAKLGVLNGIVDLNTLRFVEPDRTNIITVSTKIPYIPDAYSSLFEERYLPSVFPDPALRAYVHRFCGYCLTGWTLHEKFWVWHGAGRNGKDTLLVCMDKILGKELLANVNFASLMPSKWESGSAPSSDIARLHGARVAVASEKRKDAVLNEERIKKLTGGGAQTARFLNQNEFEFYPKFKLVLSVNDPPAINVSDFAIRQRVVLVPWLEEFTVENGKLDPHLKPELQKQHNLEGILAWMFRGLAEYHKLGGLGTCDAIEHATREYMNDQNPLHDFVNECTEVGEHLACSGSDLKAAYDTYLEHTTAKRLTNADYSSALQALSFKSEHTRSGAVWNGLRPKGVQL